ncbi:MAG: 1-phosphofructokinase [Acidobacteria bacterium]|nr:MAG: 1-phosphofructokinase [Acidobacteriota bacterium]
MIVTLTVNPAIDRTITVDRLVFDDRAYITSSSESAGGRGINSACVIHAFGGKTLAVVLAGGKSGARLEKFLTCCGFEVAVVPTRSEVRTNIVITDKQGLTVKLNEPGAPVHKEELTQLEKVIREKLEGASWLMICGSIPPGMPPSFYAKLIELARKRGVKTLLDTDGEALEAGIKAKPTVVTPNQAEAERLLNTALLTRNHFVQATERIRALGAETVILSLGSRGAMAAFDHRMMEALAPRIDAVSPIGAGDAMAAAFAWAMEKKDDYADALRWAVAAGTASAKLPGLHFATLAQTEEVYKHVEIRQVE